MEQSVREPSSCSLSSAEAAPLTCRLPDPPLSPHPVERLVLQLSDPFNLAYQDDTAHAAYRPLPRGKTPSFGHCIVVASVLHEELARLFPGEVFTLESGHVYTTRGNSVFSHVHAWIHWTPANSSGLLKDVNVIDKTVGQFTTAPHTVSVKSAKSLAQQGIFYQSLRTFPDLEAFCDQLALREPNVRTRIELFRDRFHAAWRSTIQCSER